MEISPISREIYSSPTISRLWSNAVMSIVSQPAGTYRLLEDPLLPGRSKRQLSGELIPSGSSYLHQWLWRKKHVMDSQQQLSRHRQRDSGKKQTVSPNLTDGAWRTKLPPKTGGFWAWGFCIPAEVISLPQETVGKSKLGDVNARCSFPHQRLYKLEGCLAN